MKTVYFMVVFICFTLFGACHAKDAFTDVIHKTVSYAAKVIRNIQNNVLRFIKSKEPEPVEETEDKETERKKYLLQNRRYDNTGAFMQLDSIKDHYMSTGRRTLNDIDIYLEKKLKEANQSQVATTLKQSVIRHPQPQDTTEKHFMYSKIYLPETTSSFKYDRVQLVNVAPPKPDDAAAEQVQSERNMTQDAENQTKIETSGESPVKDDGISIVEKAVQNYGRKMNEHVARLKEYTGLLGSGRLLYNALGKSYVFMNEEALIMVNETLSPSIIPQDEIESIIGEITVLMLERKKEDYHYLCNKMHQCRPFPSYTYFLVELITLLQQSDKLDTVMQNVVIKLNEMYGNNTNKTDVNTGFVNQPVPVIDLTLRLAQTGTGETNVGEKENIATRNDESPDYQNTVSALRNVSLKELDLGPTLLDVLTEPGRNHKEFLNIVCETLVNRDAILDVDEVLAMRLKDARMVIDAVDKSFVIKGEKVMKSQVTNILTATAAFVGGEKPDIQNDTNTFVEYSLSTLSNYWTNNTKYGIRLLIQSLRYGDSNDQEYLATVREGIMDVNRDYEEYRNKNKQVV